MPARAPVPVSCPLSISSVPLVYSCGSGFCFLASAQPFVSRVDDRVAPGYSTIVKKPMFLRKILSKCRERQYTSVASFKADIDLIVSNCFLFNPPGSPSAWLRDRALQLQQLAMQRLSDQPQISAYEAAVVQNSYQLQQQQFAPFGIYDD